MTYSTVVSRGRVGGLLALVGALLAALSAVAAPQAPTASTPQKVDSISMKVTMSLEAPKGQNLQLPPGMDKLEMSFWSKGKMSRMDMPMGMGSLIGDGKSFYMYNANTKTAVQLADTDLKAMGQQIGMIGGPGATSPDEIRRQMAALTKSAKKVGTEKVEGRDTTVYLVEKIPGTDQPVPTGQAIKVYVATGLPVPMPVKVEASIPGGGKAVMLMKELKFNAPVDEKLFQLPAGTQVQRGGMMPPPAPQGEPKPDTPKQDAPKTEGSSS